MESRSSFAEADGRRDHCRKSGGWMDRNPFRPSGGSCNRCCRSHCTKKVRSRQSSSRDRSIRTSSRSCWGFELAARRPFRLSDRKRRPCPLNSPWADCSLVAGTVADVVVGIAEETVAGIVEETVAGATVEIAGNCKVASRIAAGIAESCRGRNSVASKLLGPARWPRHPIVDCRGDCRCSSPCRTTKSRSRKA